jgi:hypothetical protein
MNNHTTRAKQIAQMVKAPEKITEVASEASNVVSNAIDDVVPNVKAQINAIKIKKPRNKKVNKQ